ncbi:hypothetical protein BJ970_001734 [Saccharopolyspora phatthalungensis]|uniref:Uncharacterized protein n=1 Tax=Saccharopolyspora phatthalungensis TaxID=664693 RepID=A0A840Q2P0_9PSEU|nr:hypothetical protein [Saccharopolyspora phatthalungensis]
MPGFGGIPVDELPHQHRSRTGVGMLAMPSAQRQ